MSMVQQSSTYDLGRDQTRMTEQDDVVRQRGTVDEVLERFFDPDPSKRWELQIVADEVGMGKTFVALGVAFSLLEYMRQGRRRGTMTGNRSPPSLRGCYRKVVVVTPNNQALFNKWSREVGEFVLRCVPEPSRERARWFKPRPIEHLDDLVAAMIDPDPDSACILITHTGALTRRLMDYALKRRRLLAELFRRWNQSFRHDARSRLLKGAPEDWPRDSRELATFDVDEEERLLFPPEAYRDALDRYLATKDGHARAAKALELCKDAAQPYRRGRDDLFKKIGDRLNEIHRGAVARLAEGALPLVIVDEAHNWKNGPSRSTHGYEVFESVIGSRARRMLLLTATPFQLHPSEMLELLRIGESLQFSANVEEAAVRREALKRHREQVVEPALGNARRSSRSFAKQWGSLPARITTQALAELWDAEHLRRLRTRLRRIAEQAGAITNVEIRSLIDDATAEIDPDVRGFIRKALHLYAHNEDLSVEMGHLVIRHRRRTEHRQFLIGREFGERTTNDRFDAHVLHTACGLDVGGTAELPHYLLMRSVAQMKWDEGNRGARTSLGTALTGCYSTLLHSADGRAIRKRLAQSAEGKFYLEMLLSMVTKDSDPEHPKVRAVVEEVVDRWKAGDKSLLFCFRTNTADRLASIIRKRIDDWMETRRRSLDGEEALRRFRSRLTNRTQDLVMIGLDRVLWSAWWALGPMNAAPGNEVSPHCFSLTTVDLRALARLSLQFQIPLVDERVDRVFLTRSTEHVLAVRWLEQLRPSGQWNDLLVRIADPSWVKVAYGGELHAGEDDDDPHDRPATDERGVHTIYTLVDESPTPASIDSLARELEERRLRAGERSVLDAYVMAPSLWLGVNPTRSTQSDLTRADVLRLKKKLHQHLWRLTQNEGLDFVTRRLVMQGLRRAVLRDSILLRLLPEDSDKGEARWGEVLVRSFFAPLQGQLECMAARVAVYLEDLAAASGGIQDSKSQRFALHDATRLREGFVSLVTGATKNRDRVFTGFNTPLAPEILICTAVGQEGIDLHRHCRHVVHYDLPWNPALLEQRTGRVDRIGSKTFRERDLASASSKPRLDVGVPFLAGTYDERVYEELRLRAQTFEVLTGGDVVVDDQSASDDQAEGTEAGLRFVALPDSMANDLRVRLEVERHPKTMAQPG